jgi:hypothetical protein
MFFVFFAGLAMTVGEGLWSNTISFIAITLGGVFAFTVGPPIGVWAMEKMDKPVDFLWFFLFAAVWLTFFLFVVIFRILTDRISTVRVRFVPPLELVAGPLMGLMVAVLFTSFVANTLWHYPIASGEWDLKAAASWQQSTFQVFAGPFHTIANHFLGDDFAT